MIIRTAASWLFRRGWIRSARLVAAVAPPPTNRAHLLIDPSPGDDCDAFTQDATISDCETDGHYLCGECARRNPEMSLFEVDR